jgi:hypothetical protein
VRSALPVAELNGLDSLAGYVQSAYIDADSKENLSMREAEPEFGPRFMGRPNMTVSTIDRFFI